MARYDEVAEWYVEFARSWDAALHLLLPDDISGQRVLDLGCGYGRVTRELAQRGARMIGVDVSANLLERARGDEADDPLGITYVQGDATTTEWWDGEAYDGVVCHMALMDIDDLDGALATCAAVVKPGGWFTFSIFHPCYPGGREGSTWSFGGQSSWPPDLGYATEGWWTTGGEGVRGHVGANHRMLSTYLNAVLAAGFAFDTFAEPRTELPLHFIARCHRR
jgi:SAM-dependent methyltransferase